MSWSGEETITKQQRILIVDDDPDTCDILELLFTRKGFKAVTANSGQDALDCFESLNPDLCILDVMMPGMDGWETYERVRSLSDIPVLFLTAVTSGESAARALNLGVSDYVRKPFNTNELVARSISLLNQAAAAAGLQGSWVTQSWLPSVSVIIPTLNEAENLPFVLPYLPLDWLEEVILVDGCSNDDTVEVARRLLPSIKIILESRPGKGAALSAGYRAAHGEIILVLDADGSHDPREIPRYIKALMQGADFAKGTRFAAGGGTTDMPRLRQFGNWFFVFLVNQLLNVHFTDLCYGYHAFWRHCLDEINLDDVDGFEIDTAIYLRSLSRQLRLVEVPSFEGYRFRGEGKLRTFPDGWRVLLTILRETWRHYFTPDERPHEGFRGQNPRGLPHANISSTEDQAVEQQR